MTLHSSQEFKNNPVTILFKPSRLPIENVTFPQLTIGKQNNINDEFVKQVGWLQEEYKVTTTAVIKFNGMDMDRDQIKNFLILMKTFCQPWFRGSNWQPTDSPVEREDRLMLNFDIDEFRLTDFGKEETLVENLALKIIEGTPKCSEMMVACTFNSMPVDCSEVFQDTYTESGPACSFNAMPSTLLRRQDTVITMLEKIQRNIGETENNAWKSWNVHKSLQTNITRGGRKIGVPDFQEQEGQWFGFQFIIKYPERGAHCHQSDSNNYRFFKLTVNFPLDEPNLRDHGRDIPPGYKAINVIKPSVIMAEEDSHSAPPVSRIFDLFAAYFGWQSILPLTNTNGTRDCKCLPGCNEVMYEMTTTLIPYPTDELPELVQDFLQE
ncbi:uncharacterized protein LOC118436566 [Folsomia candida]|uniref:uncharacterized protein LOC118436566 n=1 Tax=Folsomia candida TaxID=158441 RepID=UPI001604B4A5|nr:uncharacterized protein LOC118436566 [Folsomia candida]